MEGQSGDGGGEVRGVTAAQMGWTGIPISGDVRPADVTAAAEQIGRLICECDQLRRERIEQAKEIQALLSRLMEAGTERLRLLSLLPEEATTDDPVKADVDKVLDHIMHRRAMEHHDKLKRTMEQAERVPPGSDAAVGRAIR